MGANVAAFSNSRTRPRGAIRTRIAGLEDDFSKDSNAKNGIKIGRAVPELQDEGFVTRFPLISCYIRGKSWSRSMNVEPQYFFK